MDFANLAGESWDVLIVGGGIVGAGVARDAAMRGLRTALVEQNDFAFGTSSRSSRLLHGGLRYLAQGRIGLVRQSSLEKCTLYRIAPHLCEPLPFLFPTYRHTSWPRWKLSIGVRLYDFLCGGRNLGPSSTLSAGEILERLPGLNRSGLTGGVRYFDALTNDARLVIDTLRSAAGHGAVVRNYTKFLGADRSAARWTCRLRDGTSLEELQVEARVVVNATGCWAHTLPHSRVKLRLTKGIHLVVDQARFPMPEAVVMSDASRILFAIPWGTRVILGTTDTDYAGSLEDVPVDAPDVSYVLDMVNGAFPQTRLQPSDVISHWAGIRPLIAPKRTQKGAPSDTSRGHQIAMPEPGWLDVAGGKLTTYRLMAEEAVDWIGRHLRRSLPRCRTGDEPLLSPAEAAGISGVLPPAVTLEVVEHYGTREWATNVDDIMLRRASWQHYHKDAGQIARQVNQWLAEILPQ